MTDGSSKPATLVALDDFDGLFDRVIAPALAPYEAERQKVMKGFWRFVIAGGVLGFAISAAIGIVGKGDMEAVIGTAVFFAVGAAAFGFMPVARFQERCKDRALGDLAAALEMTYDRAGFEAPAYGRFTGLGLVEARSDSREYEDLFAGERQGASFQLYEARIVRGTGKNRRTVFAGQLLRIAFPKKFLGTTIINRDIAKWSKPAGFQKVGLESSEFERIFEVFGTDQVEARFLVHPVFMEKLIALETAMLGRNLRCAFDDGDLLVAVEGGNLFEIIDVFKPLPNREQTKKGIAELQAVLNLIDAILMPPKNVWAERAGKA